MFLRQVLLQVFQKVKWLEFIPVDCCRGIVKPLVKEGNNSNYPGVTISLVAYKSIVSIIEHQTMVYIEENNILRDYQGASYKVRRCEYDIIALQGICAPVKKIKKQKLYLSFLDVSKVFDVIDRTTPCMLERSIQGKAWNMIKMPY